MVDRNTTITLLMLFCTKIYSAQRIILSIDITPSVNNDYDLLQPHLLDYQQLPDVCYEYEFISRTYPHVYYNCYIKLISEYLTNNCSLHVGLSLQTFYQMIFDDVSHKVYNSLIDYAQRKPDTFDLTNEKRAQLDMMLKCTKVAEVLSYDDFDVKITDNKMIFYVLNNLVNKLIYKGLSVLFNCMKCKRSFLRLNEVSNVMTNKTSKMDTQLTDNIISKNNISIEAFANFNISDLISSISAQSATKKSVLLELNISSYILHQLVDMIFLLPIEDDIISEIFYDDNLCNSKISANLDDFLNKLEVIILNLACQQKMNKWHLESMVILLERQTIDHFIRYNYNLSIENYRLLHSLLHVASKRVAEWQNIIITSREIKLFTCDIEQESWIRTAYKFLINNFIFESFHSNLNEYFNSSNTDLENISKLISSITCGTITILGTNEGSVAPCFSVQNLINNTEIFQNNLKDSVCMLGVHEIADYIILNYKGKNLVTQSFVVVQECMLIYKSLQATFLKLEDNGSLLQATDYSLVTFLDTLISEIVFIKENLNSNIIKNLIKDEQSMQETNMVSQNMTDDQQYMDFITSLPDFHLITCDKAKTLLLKKISCNHSSVLNNLVNLIDLVSETQNATIN